MARIHQHAKFQAIPRCVLKKMPGNRKFGLIHTVEMSPKWGKSTDDDQNLKSVLKMFRIHQYVESWRRHQMETYSALLALCVGDLLVTGEFPSQRPVTLSFDVFFDLRPNKRFSKQSWGWWFETPSRSLWHYYFLFFLFIKTYLTRMTHQPEAVLHEVLPYTITQFIHMVTRKST